MTSFWRLLSWVFHLSRAVYLAVSSLCLSSSSTPVTFSTQLYVTNWSSLIHSTNLINPPVNSAVQDAAHQKTLHIRGVDVQFTRDEPDVNAGVGFDELDQNLPNNTNDCSPPVRNYYLSVTCVRMFLRRSSMCSRMKVSSMMVCLFTCRKTKY